MRPAAFFRIFPVTAVPRRTETQGSQALLRIQNALQVPPNDHTVPVKLSTYRIEWQKGTWLGTRPQTWQTVLLSPWCNFLCCDNRKGDGYGWKSCLVPFVGEKTSLSPWIMFEKLCALARVEFLHEWNSIARAWPTHGHVTINESEIRFRTSYFSVYFVLQHLWLLEYSEVQITNTNNEKT